MVLHLCILMYDTETVQGQHHLTMYGDSGYCVQFLRRSYTIASPQKTSGLYTIQAI